MSTLLLSSLLRRDFLLSGLPACALAGLGLASAPLFGQTAAPAPQAGKPAHKFDGAFPRVPSYRQLFRMQYAALIDFLEYSAKAIGRDKVIDTLKAYSEENAGPAAEDSAKRLGSRDFAALKKMFSPDSPPYANTLVFTVARSDDKVHELRVTECLWAQTFAQAKAGDLGYAGVCFGDYKFAKAFHPQIEMVRDKTLMQGHDCCNHQYVWKG
jgi:hypothetical protein